MSVYRTLSERPELWRTPRSRREANIGPIDTKQPSAEFLAILKAELERDQRPPCGWPGLLFWAGVVAFSGWAFVSLVFSFPWGN